MINRGSLSLSPMAMAEEEGALADLAVVFPRKGEMNGKNFKATRLRLRRRVFFLTLSSRGGVEAQDVSLRCPRVLS
jgi:hypothetical protein